MRVWYDILYQKYIPYISVLREDDLCRVETCKKNNLYRINYY